MARKNDDPPKKKPRVAEVIHVTFGKGGGRVSEPPPAAPSMHGTELAPTDAGYSDTKRPEPLADVFTAREVEKLLGLGPRFLKSLDRTGIVSPSGVRGRARAYTFQDLIALRATSELLRSHVKLRDVARAIGALRSTLPRVTKPLQELRIVSDGSRVVVRADEGVFEPVTGQMILDFQVNSLRDDVVRLLRPETQKNRARTAYDLYVRASALDEESRSYDEAEALYRKAIELDPKLSIAYTNLGNIRFRRGDVVAAEELYRRALEVDDRQPEAHYNLGYVMLERGHAQRAIPYFQKAIQSDPKFADAHFNLAMALENLSESGRARTHWRRYLELEPTGPWADVARDHLRKRPD